MRQLLEQGGMYGLEKPIGDMKFVTDTRYLAAMNAPGGNEPLWFAGPPACSAPLKPLLSHLLRCEADAAEK